MVRQRQKDGWSVAGAAEEGARGALDGGTDAVLPREADELLPEVVARDRIDARRRLVQDQHLRPVQDGGCKLEALANAEDALRALLELYEELGRPVPGDLVQDSEAGAIEVDLLVPAR